MITLRPDQDKAVRDMRAALSTYDSVLLRAPCRFGKTVVAAYMASRVTSRGKRFVFACHRDSIMDQTSNTFDSFNIKHGFIKADRPSNPFALAQIASADTLRNRLQLLKGASVLVVDEAHLWASKTRKLIIDEAKRLGVLVVGLSATPIRLDGKPLNDLFSHMVLGPEEADMVEAGTLAQYRAFAFRADLTGIKSSRGDYTTTSAAEILNKPAVIGNLVKEWKKHAGGRRTVVYAINRDHGKNICQQYNDAGVPAGYIDGDTPKNEQIRIINQLADDEIKVLVSVELLTTGFDLSSIVKRTVPIQCVQLARPTKSLQLAIQMMMRCMTAQDGVAIILDHVNIILNADGTVNHGFPDDRRKWTLEGCAMVGAPSEVEFSITTCMDCFGAYKSSLRVCPHCQSERQARPRAIEEREGQLEEIKRKDAEAALKRDFEAAIKSARSLDELAMVAVEYDKDPKWLVATSRYRKRNKITYEQAKKAMFDATGRFKQARGRSDA